MADDAEKARIEGIQEIIKANKEGFAEVMQTVAQGNMSRMKSAFAHSQSIRDTGAAEEKSSFSREAAGLMQ